MLGAALRSINVMRLRIDFIDQQELLGRIFDRSPIGMLVTPNANFFVQANRNEWHNKLLSSANVSVCDSRVIKCMLRLVGVQVPLITGSDLTRSILVSPRVNQLNYCMIGGHAGTGHKLAHQLGLHSFVQIEFPYKKNFTNEEVRELCSEMDGAYDVAFICLGSPLQERVASTLREIAPDRFPTLLCVGASIDFLTGAQRRAPRVIQKMGAEWLFRLITQPRRMFRRYIIENSRIIPLFIKWAIYER